MRAAHISMMNARERREAAASDRQLAIHESGHVIGHIYFNHAFKVAVVRRVRTRNGFDHAGYVKPGRGHVEWQADSIELHAARVAWLEDDMVITLSGMAAGRRYAPRSDWRGIASGDTALLQGALDLLL
jgi:hypothetical protein